MPSLILEAETVNASNDNFRPALISLNEICATLTVSRTAVNILRAAGDFPQPVELGERRIAFVRDEFDAWLQARIKARPKAA
nr:AlpA family phage regulatory protein [Devosia sp. A16]